MIIMIHGDSACNLTTARTWLDVWLLGPCRWRRLPRGPVIWIQSGKKKKKPLRSKYRAIHEAIHLDHFDIFKNIKGIQWGWLCSPTSAMRDTMVSPRSTTLALTAGFGVLRSDLTKGLLGLR